MFPTSESRRRSDATEHPPEKSRLSAQERRTEEVAQEHLPRDAAAWDAKIAQIVASGKGVPLPPLLSQTREASQLGSVESRCDYYKSHPPASLKELISLLDSLPRGRAYPEPVLRVVSERQIRPLRSVVSDYLQDHEERLHVSPRSQVERIFDQARGVSVLENDGERAVVRLTALLEQPDGLPPALEMVNITLRQDGDTPCVTDLSFEGGIEVLPAEVAPLGANLLDILGIEDKSISPEEGARNCIAQPSRDLLLACFRQSEGAGEGRGEWTGAMEEEFLRANKAGGDKKMLCTLLSGERGKDHTTFRAILSFPETRRVAWGWEVELNRWDTIGWSVDHMTPTMTVHCPWSKGFGARWTELFSHRIQQMMIAQGVASMGGPLYQGGVEGASDVLREAHSIVLARKLTEPRSLREVAGGDLATALHCAQQMCDRIALITEGQDAPRVEELELDEEALVAESGWDTASLESSSGSSSGASSSAPALPSTDGSLEPCVLWNMSLDDFVALSHFHPEHPEAEQIFLANPHIPMSVREVEAIGKRAGVYLNALDEVRQKQTGETVRASAQQSLARQLELLRRSLPKEGATQNPEVYALRKACEAACQHLKKDRPLPATPQISRMEGLPGLLDQIETLAASSSSINSTSLGLALLHLLSPEEASNLKLELQEIFSSGLRDPVKRARQSLVLAVKKAALQRAPDVESAEERTCLSRLVDATQRLLDPNPKTRATPREAAALLRGSAHPTSDV